MSKLFFVLIFFLKACSSNLAYKNLSQINTFLKTGEIEGRWYFITKSNKNYQAFLIDNGPDYFSEGLARYLDEGRVGFIDERGSIVIAARYHFASAFEKGLSAVCINCNPKIEGEIKFYQGGRWGIIDNQGNVKVPLEYDSVEYYPEKKEVWGIKSGKKIPLKLN